MIYVSSITLNKTRIVVQKDHEYILEATVLPENATNKNLKWTTTDSSVATVSNGKVTGIKAGSAYICAEATDGSYESTPCHVEVTNDVLVTNIELNASALNMSVGDGFMLVETIKPTNATNCRLSWSSSDYRVATVDPEDGFVMARGVGTAVIEAMAIDGSGVFAECAVTVDTPVPVTGIEICPEKVSLSVDDTYELVPQFKPSNASDRGIIWESSNTDVASIGVYSGTITAYEPGTTTITATTHDGGFKATCKVIVKEPVIVQRDGGYNKVVFTSTGKVWKCINQDMIFDRDLQGYHNLAERSNYNFYLHLDKNGNNDGSGYKEYSDDEIKLLYAIDPYGVCNYINRVGAEISDPEDRVKYKNAKFKLLFNRDPKYFGRNLNGEWGEVSGYIEIDDVLSESELLFGGHRIWDDYAFLQALEELIAVVDLVLSVVPQFRSISSWLDDHKTFDNILKVFSFIFGTLSDGVVSSTIDAYSPPELNGTPLSWANILVTNYMNLVEFLSETNSTPNCYPQIFDYYIKNLNYDINIEFSNGEIYELERIRESLELSE